MSILKGFVLGGCKCCHEIDPPPGDDGTPDFNPWEHQILTAGSFEWFQRFPGVEHTGVDGTAIGADEVPPPELVNAVLEDESVFSDGTTNKYNIVTEAVTNASQIRIQIRCYIPTGEWFFSGSQNALNWGLQWGTALTPLTPAQVTPGTPHTDTGGNFFVRYPQSKDVEGTGTFPPPKVFNGGIVTFEGDRFVNAPALIHRWRLIYPTAFGSHSNRAGGFMPAGGTIRFRIVNPPANFTP